MVSDSSGVGDVLNRGNSRSEGIFLLRCFSFVVLRLSDDDYLTGVSILSLDFLDGKRSIGIFFFYVL